MGNVVGHHANARTAPSHLFPDAEGRPRPASTTRSIRRFREFRTGFRRNFGDSLSLVPYPEPSREKPAAASPLFARLELPARDHRDRVPPGGVGTWRPSQSPAGRAGFSQSATAGSFSGAASLNGAMDSGVMHLALWTVHSSFCSRRIAPIVTVLRGGDGTPVRVSRPARNLW